MYTTDRNERDVLYTKAGWGYEGEGWFAPDMGTGTPVYRLYNPRDKNHLYTSDLNEIRVLTSFYGWSQDNNGEPLFYSGGAVNVYRVYNRSKSGLHHWTTDLVEYNTVPSQGWVQEGVAFQAVRVGLPIKTQYYKQQPTPPAPGGNNPGQNLPNSGNYTFTKRRGVRRQPKASAPIDFYYEKGQTVFYDQKLTAEGKTWISYMSHSGVRRYILID